MSVLSRLSERLNAGCASGVVRQRRPKRMPVSARDTSGNIAIIFGLSAMVLFGAVGGAIDFGRWNAAKQQVQYAADAAALAAGRAMQSNGGDQTDALEMASAYFNKMKPAGMTGTTPTFAVEEDGTVVRGTIDMGIETTLLAVLGYPEPAGEADDGGGARRRRQLGDQRRDLADARHHRLDGRPEDRGPEDRRQGSRRHRRVVKPEPVHVQDRAGAVLAPRQRRQLSQRCHDRPGQARLRRRRGARHHLRDRADRA